MLNKTKTIAIIEPRNEADPQLHNEPEDIQLFLDAIVDVSNKAILGKGDLLIFGKNQIFHQGYPGDAQAISLIAPEYIYSRSFFHHAGLGH